MTRELPTVNLNAGVPTASRPGAVTRLVVGSNPPARAKYSGRRRYPHGGGIGPGATGAGRD